MAFSQVIVAEILIFLEQGIYYLFAQVIVALSVAVAKSCHSCNLRMKISNVLSFLQLENENL